MIGLITLVVYLESKKVVIFKKIRLIKNIIKNNFLPKSKLTKDIVYLLKKNHTASPVIFDVGV